MGARPSARRRRPPAGRGLSGVWTRLVRRHPRAWGLALAGLLFVGYVGALRPARLWFAERVAYPAFAAIDTPRAGQFRVERIERRPDAVWAVPRELYDGRDASTLIREDEARVAQWAVPVGVIFLLPAMFLAAAFPARPYWLWLLAYHVVLGAVSFGVFALGLGLFGPAFEVYTFSRTYLAETVSLVVPVLLALAGGEVGRRGAPPAAASAQ